MELRKQVQAQDSGLKVLPAKSGESGINLSNEIIALIYKGDFTREFKTPISFRIYREDFEKALVCIKGMKSLYKTSSQDFKKIEISEEFINKYEKEINSFFGEDDVKTYRCNLLLREDGRNYLNDLKIGGFSIRDFLVENNSELVFRNCEDELIELRVISCANSMTNSKLIFSETQHCTFALKCMTYFRDSVLWNNIDSFVSDFQREDNILVAGENFHLTGMFKYVDEQRLSELNSPHRRWYLEPFLLKDKIVYLSTEWYPSNIGDRKYPLQITDLGNFISACFGKEYKIIRNKDIWELWGPNGGSDCSMPVEKSFSVSEIIEIIEKTGLLYDSNLIKRLAFSLMAKPFLILSGLAGSGKTQLALAFAQAIIEDNRQLKFISVGADWTNREQLLGFPNALVGGKYIKTENCIIDLLIEANKPENYSKPYFLILDEMNMSYVERYFSDFLSSMESHTKIHLWDKGNSEIPAEIALPKNLYIIGTINVDETTYMFSPKVLDRANVIEFKISYDEMNEFLQNMRPVKKEGLLGSASNMARDFVTKSQDENIKVDQQFTTVLKKFFKELSCVNAEFGYRTATEIFRFISQAKFNDVAKDSLTDNEIIDAAIVQKLLPKLHGSRKKLEPVLRKLWALCFSDNLNDTIDMKLDNVKDAIYKLSADKICRMYESANANGFTSFAEA